MVAFIAQNDMDGIAKTIDYREAEKINEGAFILDVRVPEECLIGSIEGSVMIPHVELRERLDEIPKDKEIIILCAMGLRGHIAYRVLAQKGYKKIYNLTGGYKTYKSVMDDRKARDNSPLDNIPQQKESDISTLDLDEKDIFELDACGLQCPGPILQLKKKVDSIEIGQAVRVQSTDPGFFRDVNSWSNMTNNALFSLTKKEGIIEAVIIKGDKSMVKEAKSKNGASLIVFSNDLDKALAALVLANGAAATGKDVTMFFTFWGLSVVRKKPNTKVKKDFMGKMFTTMLPKDMDSLKLSSMNFAGMGPKMMKGRMKKKTLINLEKCSHKLY